MGRNLNLIQMLGLPKKVCCPKCGKYTEQGFEDYDVDGPYSNKSPGKWVLGCFCGKCEYEWDQEFKLNVEVKNDK